MFGRSTRLRRELEGTKDEEEKDYRAILIDMLFVHPENYNIPTGTGDGRVFKEWQHLFIKSDGNVDNKLYKEMYEKILAGDPKARSLRMTYTKIYTQMGKKYGLNNRSKGVKEDGK